MTLARTEAHGGTEYEIPYYNFHFGFGTTRICPGQLRKGVPKYNVATESVFKGTVEDVVDRRCPVSGGVGSHILLRLQDNTTIEVPLATTDFTKMIEMNLRKGDRVEITGFKTEFEGVPTIFARSVRRGIDEFIVRDKDGQPAG